MQAAAAEVKRALGSDAIILATQKHPAGPDNTAVFEIIAAPPGASETSPEVFALDQLKSELMRLKDMVSLLHHAGGIGDNPLSDPLTIGIYADWVRIGIKERYVRKILEDAVAASGDNTASAETIRKNALYAVMKSLPLCQPFDTDDSRQTLAALVGTTGVGKTTTIAKIAAQLMFKAHKKVGLISIDTYRIGAMEQLKAYADILGVPCFQAFQRKDLDAALKRMNNRDVVLIDTAGQSQYDQMRLSELRTMLNGNQEIRSHLLLSVATSEAEMSAATLKFRCLGYDSLIFTKFDEAELRGAVFNHVMQHGLPISFITTGQNVPEDIEAAEQRRIVKWIFNKNRVNSDWRTADGSSH